MAPVRTIVDSFSLAPGADLVARRESAALFLAADADPALLTAFTDAPTDAGAIAAVCDLAGDTDQLETFAVVSWAPVSVIVSGALDIGLHDATSQRVVSGRGSTTWVAHSPRSTETLTISVGDSAVDASTELGVGSVRAGGFVVTVSSPATANTPGEATTSRTSLVSSQQAPSAPSTHLVPVVELGSSGRRLSLDQPVLIGRSPDVDSFPTEAGLVGVQIDDVKLSRSHLIVSCVAGSVVVTDCDSTNGTIIVEEPGARPQALAPHEPLRIDDDAVIYLGDETLRLT